MRRSPTATQRHCQSGSEAPAIALWLGTLATGRSTEPPSEQCAPAQRCRIGRQVQIQLIAYWAVAAASRASEAVPERSRGRPRRNVDLERDEGLLGGLASIASPIRGTVRREAVRSGLGDGLRLLGVFLLAATGEHLQLVDDDLGLPMANPPLSSSTL